MEVGALPLANFESQSNETVEGGGGGGGGRMRGGGFTLTFMLTLAPTNPKDSRSKTSAQESIVARSGVNLLSTSFYYNVHSSCCMRAQHSSKGHGCP